MNEKNGKIEISIILACYNASSYIEESVKQIQDVMDATVYHYELIFVDDKSKDDTVHKIRNLIKNKKNCHLYLHRTNCGRGKTVFDGFRKSKGEIIGFIDLDLDNPARYIFSMVLGIKKGDADICTAQRVYRWRYNPYFLIRILMSKVYAKLSSIWLQTGLKDTETGCKFFKKEKIISILKQTKSRGWFWDTEVMTRAHYAGLKIIEVPTLFVRNTKVSTVTLLPDVMKYLYHLIQFGSVNRELRNKWLYRKEKENIF